MKNTEDYLKELRDLVHEVSDCLAHIDQISDCLVPNSLEEETTMTEEQQKKYDSIMDSLKNTIQTEFSFLLEDYRTF